MNIQEILLNYSPKLKKTSLSPVLDIELLLTKILNKEKEYLYEYPEKKLGIKQLADFKKLFNRHLQGEPIAYILGHKEFYNLDLKVNKNVLIPRPETELLVEEVLKYIKSFPSKLITHYSLLDLGVGSGAIIIALAHHFCHTEPVECIDKNARIKFYATEISEKAIKVAKENAQKHKVKIKFLKGNLLTPFTSIPNTQYSKLILVANLPYLTPQELKNPTIQKEPKIALDGGKDGLKYFHALFSQIKKFNLKPRAIFLEIGHKQADKIKGLAKKTLPNYKFKVKKDLCGFDRVVIIKK